MLSSMTYSNIKRNGVARKHTKNQDYAQLGNRVSQTKGKMQVTKHGYMTIYIFQKTAAQTQRLIVKEIDISLGEGEGEGDIDVINTTCKKQDELLYIAYRLPIDCP